MLANVVTIKATDGHKTKYVHVRPADSLFNADGTPKVNQQVSSGALIGTLDDSGCQSAPHLHVGRYDTAGNAVNFTIPCINPEPTTKLWDGLVDDDVPDEPVQ